MRVRVPERLRPGLGGSCRHGRQTVGSLSGGGGGFAHVRVGDREQRAVVLSDDPLRIGCISECANGVGSVRRLHHSHDDRAVHHQCHRAERVSVYASRQRVADRRRDPLVHGDREHDVVEEVECERGFGWRAGLGRQLRRFLAGEHESYGVPCGGELVEVDPDHATTKRRGLRLGRKRAEGSSVGGREEGGDGVARSRIPLRQYRRGGEREQRGHRRNEGRLKCAKLDNCRQAADRKPHWPRTFEPVTIDILHRSLPGWLARLLHGAWPARERRERRFGDQARFPPKIVRRPRSSEVRRRGTPGACTSPPSPDRSGRGPRDRGSPRRRVPCSVAARNRQTGNTGVGFGTDLPRDCGVIYCGHAPCDRFERLRPACAIPGPWPASRPHPWIRGTIHQLLVESAHRLEARGGGHDARFAVHPRLDQHHDAHRRAA